MSLVEIAIVAIIGTMRRSSVGVDRNNGADGKDTVLNVGAQRVQW